MVTIPGSWIAEPCVNRQQSSALPWDGTPTSQARAACVPSGQLVIAAA